MSRQTLLSRSSRLRVRSRRLQTESFRLSADGGCLAINVRTVKFHVALRSGELTETMRAVEFVGVAGHQQQSA